MNERRVRDALITIGARARVSNLRRADHLDASLDLLEAGTLSASDRADAIRSAHQLAGSAGTFGLAPASTLASWFEAFFTRFGDQDPAPANGDFDAARAQLTELRTRLDDDPDLDD